MQLKSRKEKTLFIFADGGARGNPGPAAIGFVIKDSQGNIWAEKGEYIGKTTNNMAEYLAVIKSLEWLVNWQERAGQSIKLIKFFLDSQLVVNQLNGLFKIKNGRLRNLVIRTKALESQTKASIIYHHIQREKNKQADQLLNQALEEELQKTKA